MHSSDDDAAFAPHDCGQRFCATHDRFSAVASANKYWVVAPDCRRKDNEISSAGVLRSMRLPKTQTEPLQSISFHAANLVRAADCVPELDQKRGDTAHATACDTNQMNPVLLTREECWQVKRQGTNAPCCGASLRRRLRSHAAIFRDELHESYISP